LLKKLLETIPIIDNIQVVVVDDNSNVEIDFYNELRDTCQHVTFLTNDTGKNSAGTCRNIGLQHAKGRWILFADADDYFVEGFYEIVSEYFESEHDVVFFTPTSIDLDTGSASNRHIPYERLIKRYLQNNNAESSLWLRLNFHVPWSKLISRCRVAQDSLAFEDIPVANDVMFSTMLGLYSRNFAASDKIIYCSATKKESLTTTVNHENIFVRLDVFIRRYHLLKESLSKKDFRCLDLAGGSYFFDAFRNKYPLKLTLKVIALLRKNKIRLFRRRHFNPAYVINEIKARSNKYEKDYYKYDG
jgi:glycosyltransferase involved in cell wall biosynthesis